MHQRTFRLAVRAEPAPDAGRLSDTGPPPARPTLDPHHPLFGLGYAPPVSACDFVQLDGSEAQPACASIAQEMPVALTYNGHPHVVMMCTPADIEDFAVGFSVTEEIVRSADEISALRPVRYSQGIEVDVRVPQTVADALHGRGRSLVGRTGCGLCGVTTVAEVLRAASAVRAVPVAVQALYRAAAALPALQEYNDRTRAVHAAAWARPDGAIVVAREDVGRHNALDKTIGALLRAKIDPADGFALVTSRASYELVQKCAVVGIGVLAAVSRPTGLAIRLAEAAGITLVGLLRGRSANVYSHPAALGLPELQPPTPSSG